MFEDERDFREADDLHPVGDELGGVTAEVDEVVVVDLEVEGDVYLEDAS